ncbi:MAG: hypothetical protein WAL85_10760 [Candidatus Korobacteraceae bacterium]
MKTRNANLCQLMALTVLVCLGLSVFTLAQDSAVNNEHAVPRFTVIPPKPALPGVLKPSGTLEEWNGNFTYNNNQYNYVMVGANPDTNQGAIVTVWVVPVKLALSNGDIFDPLSGGPFSPLALTLTSPMFDSSTNYTQGGVNVGTTQYNDAFQRANFWSIVQNNPNSHLLLGGPAARVAVLPEITLNVPSGDGTVGTPFGHQVAEVSIDYFDDQISAYMASSQTINPTGLPIFITANTYLTEGGCCIGGYHSANGEQTYANFEYITYAGDFSQDVSALSHEIGEWTDDPLWPNENNTPCGILEVGDPLEGGSNGHPYGTWPYPLHNFTYHLQDLTFLRYFGAPANTSVNDWWTFQNYPYTTICEQGS